MHESIFHFKKFSVHQDKCAMKVGTDGVLLGAWVNTKDASAILDIGTGTGLIALMLAQKCPAIIDAIDIDKDAYEQAKDNIENSPWASRIFVSHNSLQEFVKFTKKKYDIVVSNPPFFSDACKAGTEARNAARHTDVTLSFHDLIKGVKSLLAQHGKFCVILPSKESHCFIESAASAGLYVKKLTRVKTKTGKQEKRIMAELQFNKPDLTDEDDIIIQETDLAFTKEYIELTKDYYTGLK